VKGKIMKKEDIAYCGLSCARCKSNFAEIRQKMKDLEGAFEKVNIKEMAKVIPFMKSKYRGYKKLIAFFSSECPGCRSNGGNPFCAIRKHNKKRNRFSCAECSAAPCSRFKSLFAIHNDNEIQNNLKQIKEKGIESLISVS
jgi:hypothetical protein